MTIKQLKEKFSQGIKWNAILFSLYKIISIISTILLFKKLSTEDFSLWANIFGTIYLTLLWLDFGFRKSLPLYCPQFSKNRILMKKFIKYIIMFQTTILLIFSTTFIFFSKYITNKFNLTDKIEIFYFGCAMFFTEGILSIFKLIYHSYFKQKQFNSLMSIIVIIKSTILFSFILVITKSYTLLKIAFILELFASILSITICLKTLKSLYNQHNQDGQEIMHKNLTAEFIFHSGIMWINNNLKSLSERNFMILFFTYLFGPLQANLFKITSDSALLLQRITVKTIGTTDTSLLFYAQTIKYDKNNFEQNNFEQNNFENLIIQISRICIPLFGIITFIVFNFNYLLNNKNSSKTFLDMNVFFIISIFYLLESILSPYERLLEVKRKYIILTFSYLPYVLAIFCLAFFKITTTLGIISTILFIQISRLLIYFIMLIIVRKKYKFYFPTKKISKIILYTFILFVFASSLKYLLL